jgi:hypothetical protein
MVRKLEVIWKCRVGSDGMFLSLIYIPENPGTAFVDWISAGYPPWEIELGLYAPIQTYRIQSFLLKRKKKKELQRSAGQVDDLRVADWFRALLDSTLEDWCAAVEDKCNRCSAFPLYWRSQGLSVQMLIRSDVVWAKQLKGKSARVTLEALGRFLVVLNLHFVQQLASGRAVWRP